MKQPVKSYRVVNAAQARRLLVAKIHIARNQLGMDDDSYRANIAHYANGKTSCTDMTVPELHAVLAAFEKLGFKPKKTATKKQPAKKYSPKTTDGPRDERSVIRAIWIFMHRAGFILDGSETALNSWVSRQTAEGNGSIGISDVEWLHGNDATKVLESLKKWCRRQMYSDLQKRGYDVWPSIDYQTLLDKWERANGAMV